MNFTLLKRYIPLAVWIVAVFTILLIPLKIISYGFLPGDDALRHAAKAVSGKTWQQILVMRGDFAIDPSPGWQKILEWVHALAGGAMPNARHFFRCGPDAARDLERAALVAPARSVAGRVVRGGGVYSGLHHPFGARAAVPCDRRLCLSRFVPLVAVEENREDRPSRAGVDFHPAARRGVGVDSWFVVFAGIAGVGDSVRRILAFGILVMAFAGWRAVFWAAR